MAVAPSLYMHALYINITHTHTNRKKTHECFPPPQFTASHLLKGPPSCQVNFSG